MGKLLLALIVVGTVLALPLTAWLIGRHLRKKRGVRRLRGWLAWATNPWFVLGVVFVLFSLSKLVMPLLGWPPRAGSSNGNVYLFIIALWLGGVSARRRGFDRHCAACKYACADWQTIDAASRCPECGALWKGRLIRSWKFRPVLLGMSIAIGLLGLIDMLGMFRGSIMQAMPAKIAIKQLPRFGPTGTASTEEFESLTARTLSAAETAALFEATLDRIALMDPPRMVPYKVSQWLQGQVDGGGLPQSLLDRYFDTLSVADIRVSIGQDRGVSRARVGDTLTIELVRRAYLQSWFHMPYARVELIELDSQQLSGGPSASFAYDAMTHDEHTFRKNDPQWRRAQGRATVVAASPGRKRIRVVYWAAVMNGLREKPPSTVNASGEPEPTPATLRLKRYEIEQTIDILPRP